MPTDSSVPSSNPPRAQRLARTTTLHGHTLCDDYHWLREKDDPQVRAYLDACSQAITSSPGRLGKAISRTPSMHVDEKPDEAIVLAKRLNKGRQLPAEVVEGRASPKGNSRQATVVRTLSRDTTSVGRGEILVPTATIEPDQCLRPVGCHFSLAAHSQSARL